MSFPSARRHEMFSILTEISASSSSSHTKKSDQREPRNDILQLWIAPHEAMETVAP